MSEEFILKVKTERLVSTSDHLTSVINKTRKQFQEIESLVSQTQSYWEGKGHDKMKKHYSSRSDDFNRAFDAIFGHIQKLKEMAGVYDEAERAIIGLEENVLTGDIIQ